MSNKLEASSALGPGLKDCGIEYMYGNKRGVLEFI